MEIEDRLSRLAQQLREREIIGSRVALLRRRQGELVAELDRLRKRHALEQRDVEKLESLSLTRFLDVWFDNIFTDLAVRDHIKRAQANLADARQRVAAVRRQLAGRSDAARQRRANLDQARQDLLVG